MKINDESPNCCWPFGRSGFVMDLNRLC